MIFVYLLKLPKIVKLMIFLASLDAAKGLMIYLRKISKKV